MSVEIFINEDRCEPDWCTENMSNLVNIVKLKQKISLKKEIIGFYCIFGVLLSIRINIIH